MIGGTVRIGNLILALQRPDPQLLDIVFKLAENRLLTPLEADISCNTAEAVFRVNAPVTEQTSYIDSDLKLAIGSQGMPLLKITMHAPIEPAKVLNAVENILRLYTSQKRRQADRAF